MPASPSNAPDPAGPPPAPAIALAADTARARFDRLADLASAAVGGSSSLMTLLDGAEQVVLGTAGLPRPWASIRSAVGSGREAPGSEPLVVDDVHNDVRVSASLLHDADVGALCVVPLVDAGGAVIGGLYVVDRAARHWTDREVALLTTLAASAVTEMEMAAAVRARDRATERLRSILDGLFIYVGLLDVDGRVEELNVAALQQGHLELESVVGASFVDAPWFRGVPRTREAIAQSIEAARAGRGTRITVELPFRTETFSLDLQFEPLRDPNGVVSGIVMSGFDITDRVRYERELADRVRRQQRERAGLGHLVQLADTLNRSATMLEITDAVARLAASVVGGVFSNLAVVVDREHIDVHHGPSLDDDVRERWSRIPLDASTPFGRALSTGRTVAAWSPAEIRRDFAVGADDAEAAGFRALVAVPLPGSDVAYGVCWDREITGDPGLMQILDTMAALVDGALRRAALYEAERSVATELQRSLLPHQLPVVPGFDIAALYEPGTDGVHVGGDWYDVVVHGDAYLAVVGDVVGRGVPAAATMGRLRNAVAAFVTAVDGVDHLMDRLDAFAQDVPGARLTTVVLARIQPDGRAEIVSAGHLPPLVRRASGRIEQLPDAGTPLGLVGSKRRDVHEVTLAPGDTLVLYTDGLVERRGESIDDGLHRLADALSAAPEPADAEHLVAHVYGALGSPRGDDVAVLAVHRLSST